MRIELLRLEVLTSRDVNGRPIGLRPNSRLGTETDKRMVDCVMGEVQLVH